MDRKGLEVYELNSGKWNQPTKSTPWAWERWAKGSFSMLHSSNTLWIYNVKWTM